MAAPTVVTLQPQYVVAGPSMSRPMWQTGLMDCCTDCGVCCCGMFCFPCLGCQVAGDMNECCLCGTSVAMRTLYRTRYNIPAGKPTDKSLPEFRGAPFIPTTASPAGVPCAPCARSKGTSTRGESWASSDAVETMPPMPHRKVAEDCP